MSKTATLSSAR